MKAFLEKDRLIPFLDVLSRQIEVIAPLATEAGAVYSTWQGQPLDLRSNPLSPPTEFLLPHKETLFRYIQESGRYTFKEDSIPPRLLFAIRQESKETVPLQKDRAAVLWRILEDREVWRLLDLSYEKAYIRARSHIRPDERDSLDAGDPPQGLDRRD